MEAHLSTVAKVASVLHFCTVLLTGNGRHCRSKRRSWMLLSNCCRDGSGSSWLDSCLLSSCCDWGPSSWLHGGLLDSHWFWSLDHVLQVKDNVTRATLCLCSYATNDTQPCTATNNFLPKIRNVRVTGKLLTSSVPYSAATQCRRLRALTSMGTYLSEKALGVPVMLALSMLLLSGGLVKAAGLPNGSVKESGVVAAGWTSVSSPAAVTGVIAAGCMTATDVGVSTMSCKSKYSSLMQLFCLCSYATNDVQPCTANNKFLPEVKNVQVTGKQLTHHQYSILLQDIAGGCANVPPSQQICLQRQHC